MTSFPADRVTSPATPDYDALAELFLGDDAPARVPPAIARIEPKPAPRPADPPLRLAGVEPEPVIAGEPARDDASRAAVDAVVLGSLPVYASAWLLQHARNESQRCGRPVALVRMLSGECSVDVVGLSPGEQPEKMPSTLEGAMAFVASACARVLLRTGETSEHDLAAHDRVDSITILTGVDDPALVAAYRTIKAMHACGKSMRVATMGAPLADGRRAFDKIRRASEAFLETQVEFAGHVEKIEPAPGVCLHRGASRASLASILDALGESAPARSSGAPREAPASERENVPEAVMASSPPPLPTPPPAPTMEDRPVERAPVVAAPTREDEPAQSLASRVKGLALTPLKAPRCDGVEIAVDAHGRVHLLLAELDDDSRDSVSALLAAGAWAQTNAELLATACATILGAPVDASAPPCLHLFTSDPRRVRPLLDADIRLHFLGRVEIDGRRAWCVAELN